MSSRAAIAALVHLYAERIDAGDPVLAGRYRDRFRRVAEMWQFAERRIHIDLVGEVGEHVRRTR